MLCGATTYKQGDRADFLGATLTMLGEGRQGFQARSAITTVQHLSHALWRVSWHMSSSSSNIDLHIGFAQQSAIMVPLSYIARLTWDESLGAKLKALRGSITRRSFAEKIKESGVGLSHQYLQELEEGKPESISVELLEKLCNGLGVSIGEFYPALKIEKVR